MRYDILRQTAEQCQEDPSFNMFQWEHCLVGKILDSCVPDWPQRPVREYLPLVYSILEVESQPQRKLLAPLFFEQYATRGNISSLVEHYIAKMQGENHEV